MGLSSRPMGPPRALTRDEAVDIAIRAAGDHGYRTKDVAEAERLDNAWRMKLRVVPRATVDVRVDAWSGAVVRYEEHRRREHRDEDEDDDEHDDDDRHDQGKHKGWHKHDD